MEHGCWDCGGTPFLDGLVDLLIVAPVFFFLLYFSYRMTLFFRRYFMAQTSREDRRE